MNKFVKIQLLFLCMKQINSNIIKIFNIFSKLHIKTNKFLKHNKERKAIKIF